MLCEYKNNHIILELMYTFFYVQLLFLTFIIFLVKLYYIVENQLIKNNYLIIHKNKFNDVIKDVNNNKDKRKWVYDFN